MNAQAFEQFTRRAATLTRRASIVTLGGAALAAAAPLASEAKKKGKKKKGNSAEDKLKKKCNNVEDECITLGTALCDGEQECLASIFVCCQECFSTDFLTCLLEQQSAQA
jgi:hypothetical protein